MRSTSVFGMVRGGADEARAANQLGQNVSIVDFGNAARSKRSKCQQTGTANCLSERPLWASLAYGLNGIMFEPPLANNTAPFSRMVATVGTSVATGPAPQISTLSEIESASSNSTPR